MNLDRFSDMNIRTQRLEIRRLLPCDADGLFAMMSDQDTCDDDGGYDAIQAQDEGFFRTLAKFCSEPNRFAIVADGEMVGTIHLMLPMENQPDDALEVGYCIVPRYRRNGFAFEATSAVIAHLHAEFGIRRFLAGTYSFNKASQRVLEKLGFSQEGMAREVCNHRKYGITDVINYRLYIE